jgi:hypothetical protein
MYDSILSWWYNAIAEQRAYEFTEYKKEYEGKCLLRRRNEWKNIRMQRCTDTSDPLRIYRCERSN